MDRLTAHMLDPHGYNLFALIVTLALCTASVHFIRSPYRKVPPGPQGVPILGNLFQLRGDIFSSFKEWQQSFGDLLYITIVGQPILIISSGNIAFDLLDRCAANYSERPRMIVGAEIMAGGLALFIRFNVSCQSTAWTRRLRKATHGAMSNQIARQYQSMQAIEAVLLTLGILDKPEDWNAHMRRTTASLTMSILYYHPPTISENNKSIQDIKNFADRLSRACRPGPHLVEVFPWMLHIPQRFAKWKREANYWFAHDTKIFEDLVDDVVNRMNAGNIRPCFTTTMIENAGDSKLSKREIAWTTGLLFAAGTETTASVMAWFMLAMVAFPSVQQRAQEELDTVVGHLRAPTFADFERLSYIQAIVKESLRWRATIPFGLPHHTLEDDWYEGMFIPKGTIRIANVHGMNRDPRVFGTDAADFNPERYLDEAGGINATSVDDHYTYGFGRRNCLGRYVANNSLFINIAVLLWAAKISRAKDDVGPLDVDGFVDDGMVIRPIPFGCDIQPRFSEVRHILSQEKELLMH